MKKLIHCLSIEKLSRVKNFDTISTKDVDRVRVIKGATSTLISIKIELWSGFPGVA